MTQRNLDRYLPAVLGELAEAPYPDYIDDVLATAATRRQRPAWSFPRRWLPMSVTTQAVPRTSLPWRPIALVALLATVLAASVGAFLAAQPKPAPWFGPANNGLIAYDAGGAIYAVDPATDETRVLKADADGWIDPFYSPDGRWILLAREPTDSTVEFAVMPADGGDIRVITPEPVNAPGWNDFSPDSRSLIFDAPVVIETSPGVNELRRSIVVIDIASGEQRVLDLGEEVHDATAIPPDGATMLATVGSSESERYVVIDLAAGTMTTLLEAEPGWFFVGRPRVSPDGRSLAYADYSRDLRHGRLHVRPMAGGDDRVIGDVEGADWTAGPVWSPDGRTLAVELMTITDYRDVPRLGFVDVRSGEGRRVDLVLYDGLAKEWSPDSSTLLITPAMAGDSQQQLLVDAATLAVTTPPWTTTSYPSWQRLP